MEEGTLGAQEEDPLGQRAGHPQGALTGLRGIFRHEPILGVTRRCASHGRQRGSMTGRTGDVSEGSGTSRAPSR